VKKKQKLENISAAVVTLHAALWNTDVLIPLAFITQLSTEPNDMMRTHSYVKDNVILRRKRAA